MRLPYGGVWLEMVLAPSDRLCINLGDLRDYYYLLRWPGPMERSSTLGPALRPEDLEALGLVGVVDCDEQWFAGLRVPAVGDGKAPAWRRWRTSEIGPGFAGTFFRAISDLLLTYAIFPGRTGPVSGLDHHSDSVPSQPDWNLLTFRGPSDHKEVPNPIAKHGDAVSQLSGEVEESRSGPLGVDSCVQHRTHMSLQT